MQTVIQFADSIAYTFNELIIYYKGGKIPDLLEPSSNKDGVLFIEVVEKPNGEEEKELDSGRAAENINKHTFELKCSQ